MKFKQQVVLVTGASRGIGAAIAQAFAKQGAVVIGTATTEQGAATINDYLQQYGHGSGMVLNVQDAEQCRHLFEMLVEKYGAPQVLVNNAGVTRDNLFLRMKDEEWQHVMDVNLNALFRLCKLAIKPMLKARYGRIINMSSIVGVTGNPGQVNYVAAKAGVIGFSKALAQEVASRQITVNVVAPGYIDTDMTAHLTETQKAALVEKIPAERVGTPADIAYAVLFLAAQEASYITGQTLHVNGGLHCE